MFIGKNKNKNKNRKFIGVYKKKLFSKFKNTLYYVENALYNKSFEYALIRQLYQLTH